MKEYTIRDKDGKRIIVERDDGITTTILEEPTPEYLAANAPDPSTILIPPKTRDYLAEIDALKADLEAKYKDLGDRLKKANL